MKMKTKWIFGLVAAITLLLIIPVSVLGWKNTGSYPVTLDNSDDDCMYPAMYNVYSDYWETEIVTWQQYEEDHWDIYFTYGSGTTWVQPIKLTNNNDWDNEDNDCTHPDVCARTDVQGEPWDFTAYITWQYEHPDYQNTWEIEVCRIYVSNCWPNWPGTVSTIEYASIHQYECGYDDISVSEWDGYDSILPAIDCGDNVHLVWEDYRLGVNDPRIYYDWSLQGLTWQRTQNDVLWSRDDFDAKDPCIAVDYLSDDYYDKICVLWEDYQTENFPQIYYHAAYLDSGSNFLHYGPAIVPNGATMNQELNPDIEDFEGEFMYVWQDDRNGDWEIYYKKSSFVASPPYLLLQLDGNTKRVTLDGGDDENPAIDVCLNDTDPYDIKNDIHICWDTDRSGNRDIYACKGVQAVGSPNDSLFSSGQGLTDNRVSYSGSIESHPDISCYSQNGYCVWQIDLDPWDIRYTVDP